MFSHQSSDSEGFTALRRHEEYYLTGGDLFFLIEQNHFRVHRYFFERESQFFKRELATPASPGATRQGTSESTAIVLDSSVKASSFAKFLWVFYNPKYSLYKARVEDWVAIMELAHRWGFHEVMKLATREIERLEMPDIDRIVAYHKFELDRSLLLHRYAALTAREEPLNLEEGMALGMDTTLKIFRAREVARATPAADGSRSPTSATLPDDEMQSLIVDLFEIPEYSEPLPDDEPPRPQPTKKSPVKAAPVKKKQETPSAVPIAPEEPPAPPAPPAKSNRTSNATTNATPTTATATTKSTNGSAWGATGSTANKPASPWGSNATTNSKSNNASSSAAATTTSTPLADVPLASTDVSPSLSTTVDESGKDAKAINKNGDKSGDKDVKKASPAGSTNTSGGLGGITNTLNTMFNQLSTDATNNDTSGAATGNGTAETPASAANIKDPELPRSPTPTGGNKNRKKPSK